MKTANGYNINPIWIYIIWIFVLIIFILFGIPILSKGSPGGEQKPFTLMADVMVILFLGLFFLSFITSFLFLNWFKKYWYINVCIFFFSFLPLYNDYWKQKESFYYRDETKYLGNDEIYIRKEYDVKDDKIRSVKYWKNEKKDSTWVFYDKQGNIFEERKYLNDSLVKIQKP